MNALDTITGNAMAEQHSIGVTKDCRHDQDGTEDGSTCFSPSVRRDWA